MKISVIIVTYNSRETISRCLNALMTQEDAQQWEIIIVDNHSTDGTAGSTSQKSPDIQLLENDTNIGFARAVNQGIRESSGDAVLILNPDTILTKDAVGHLIECMQKTKAGIVGPKILNLDGSIQPSCGRFPTPTNIIYDRIPLLRTWLSAYNFRNPRYYTKHRHPDWISGACMLIKREVIDSIGLFNEKYFMYGEDVDYCYRAQNAGYPIVMCPDAVITHHDEGTSPERRWNKFVHMRRGLVQFMKDYTPNSLQRFIRLIRAEMRLRSLFSRSLQAREARKQVLCDLNR